MSQFSDLITNLAQRDTIGSLFSFFGIIKAAPVVLTADYVLSADDNTTVFRCDNSTNITITVPNNLPEGFSVGVARWTTSTVTFVTASGGTNRSALTQVSKQYGFASVVCLKNATGSATEFLVGGDAS